MNQPPPPPVPSPGPAYSEATEKVFRAAVADLKKRLPTQHAALAALIDAGSFHDATAIKQLVAGVAQ